MEDINFKAWSKGLFCKQSLDSGIGGFINEILPFICWKRGKFYLKVDKNGTSQMCSNCGEITGKKELNQRIHSCQFCSHTEPRDTNSAKVILQRGLMSHCGLGVSPNGASGVAVGYTVKENACGEVLAGVEQLNLFNLVKIH